MTVAFADQLAAVGLGCSRSRLKSAVVSSQTHGASKIGDLLLSGHQIDHIAGRFRIHLRGIGVGQAQNVACIFYHHALHAQTDSQGGHVVFAAPFQGGKFTLDAPFPESGSNDHAVHAAQ